MGLQMGSVQLRPGQQVPPHRPQRTPTCRALCPPGWPDLRLLAACAMLHPVKAARTLSQVRVSICALALPDILAASVVGSLPVVASPFVLSKLVRGLVKLQPGSDAMQHHGHGSATSDRRRAQLWMASRLGFCFLHCLSLRESKLSINPSASSQSRRFCPGRNCFQQTYRPYLQELFWL